MTEEELMTLIEEQAKIIRLQTDVFATHGRLIRELQDTVSKMLERRTLVLPPEVKTIGFVTMPLNPPMELVSPEGVYTRDKINVLTANLISGG